MTVNDRRESTWLQNECQIPTCVLSVMEFQFSYIHMRNANDNRSNYADTVRFELEIYIYSIASYHILHKICKIVIMKSPLLMNSKMLCNVFFFLRFVCIHSRTINIWLCVKFNICTRSLNISVFFLLRCWPITFSIWNRVRRDVNSSTALY